MAEPTRDSRKPKTGFEGLFDAFGGNGESPFAKLFQILGQIFSVLFGGNGNQRTHRSSADTSAAPQTPTLIDRGRDALRQGGQAISHGWDALRAKFVSDMPTDKKLVSAQRSGNDIVYTAADGDQIIKVRGASRQGTMSWANNNPGNIEYGDFARRLGAIGHDGRFAIFESVDAGLNAQKALLTSPNYRNLTLSQAIHRWCPPSERGNDTQAYVSSVSTKTGINQTTRICDMTDAQISSVVMAMAQHEGWKPGKVAVIDNGGGGTRTASAETRPTSVARAIDGAVVASIGSEMRESVRQPVGGATTPVLRQRTTVAAADQDPRATVSLVPAPSMST